MTLVWSTRKELEHALRLLGVNRWRVTITGTWVIIELPKSTSVDVRWKLREHGPMPIGIGFSTLRWWECFFKRRQWRQQ